MGQSFYPRVSLTNTGGNHIRYVPGPLAQAMVRGGTATAATGGGKVRAVALTPQPLTRIGEPTSGPSVGVRFHRWVRLNDSATRIVEHHPRCMYE